MRRARAEDWLRALRKLPPTPISRVRLEALPGLGNIEFQLGQRLVVICGGNGAGKSTVLSGIYCALTRAFGRPPASHSTFIPKLLGGRAVVSVGDQSVPVELCAPTSDREAGNGDSPNSASNGADSGVETSAELAAGESLLGPHVSSDEDPLAAQAEEKMSRPTERESPSASELGSGFVAAAADEKTEVMSPGTRAYFWALGQESAEHIEFFSSAKNLNEILPAHESRQLDVSRSRFLAGRHYESVEVLELDEWPDKNDEARPYFRVRAAGKTYGSEAMGQGELAVLLAQWRLSRIEEGSVLLIEEIETSLPPRSQLALFDALVERVCQMKLVVIASTHSPTIANTVPRSMLRLMLSDGAGVLLRNSPSDRELATVIGITRGREWVILVEDEVACFLAKEILLACDSPLLVTAAIEPAGSDGDIVLALKGVPPFRESGVRVIGLFDGDMRPKLKGATKGFKSMHAYLPTGSSPDELLQVPLAADPSSFAHASRLDAGRVRIALAGVTGLDPHDWWIQLARTLDLNPWALRKAAFQLWIQSPDNRAAAKTLADGLLEMFTTGEIVAT